MKTIRFGAHEPASSTWRVTGGALVCAAVLINLPGAEAQGQEQADLQQPHRIEAYVSEHAVQALYTREAELPVLGDSELRGGVFFNEGRNIVGIMDALTELRNGEEAPGRRWHARIGPRVYGALLDDDNDAFSVGFGGEVRYFLTYDRDTSVMLSAYYAPDITTFGETDGVRDVSLGVRTAMSDQTNLFLGWRTFELDLADDFEIDDGFHLGVQTSF